MHRGIPGLGPWFFLWGPRFLGFVVRRSCVVSHELCCRGYWKVATQQKLFKRCAECRFAVMDGVRCVFHAPPSHAYTSAVTSNSTVVFVCPCVGSLFSVCFPSLFLNLGFACLILKVVRVRQGETQLKWTNVWGWLFDLLRLNVCFHVTACPRSQVQLS
jgi:hypothetical protein